MSIFLFTCGAKRQARLREQILGLLLLGLPDNYPVGRYDHIIDQIRCDHITIEWPVGLYDDVIK